LEGIGFAVFLDDFVADCERLLPFAQIHGVHGLLHERAKIFFFFLRLGWHGESQRNDANEAGKESGEIAEIHEFEWVRREKS
jgi:hypothetical protein